MIQRLVLMGILCTAGVFATWAEPQTTLIVKQFPLIIKGKTQNSYRIEQPDGTWGYQGVKGGTFNVKVKNETNVPTCVHWHGLIDPVSQDGVPGVSQPVIQPGESYDYNFGLIQGGTFWMHTHEGLQIQQQLSAPLILEDPQDPYKDAKSVTMFLTDFSFRSPEEINAELTKNRRHHPMAKMSMKKHGKKHAMTKPDLNDVTYDAFLTNYKTLEDPEIIDVKPGEKVRLRVTDGSASTNFFIDLGDLKGSVIATDGNATVPYEGSQFSLAMAQRLDILVTIPEAPEKAYPILAQVEGTTHQTGLILRTGQAPVPSFKEPAPKGALDPMQDARLRPVTPLPHRKIDKRVKMVLSGKMMDYIWEMDNHVWPGIKPVKVRKGDRVAIEFVNKSHMSHPIHLHGHVFQVVEINKKSFNGPLRDTVLVPPRGTAKIILDVTNEGVWMFHCHNLYHAANGMATVLLYEGYTPPKDLRIYKMLEKARKTKSHSAKKMI